jgi:hypothetical protein
METVTISRKMNAEEFWSNLLGSTEFIGEQWIKVKYHGDATWEVPGIVTITADNGEEVITKSLTIEDLVEAYEVCVANGYHHCGMKINIDDMDECASDIVLQQAMFGDVIYG